MYFCEDPHQDRNTDDKYNWVEIRWDQNTMRLLFKIEKKSLKQAKMYLRTLKITKAMSTAVT